MPVDGEGTNTTHSEDNGNIGNGRDGQTIGEWSPPTLFQECDLPRFPTEALPSWLRDFVEAEATATQTPPDLAAMLVLSVTAAACAKKVKMRVKPGWSEPANLYCVTALEPGNRKSTVFADVAAPLNEFEEAEVKRMAPIVAKAKAQYDIAVAALQGAKNAAGKARDVERDKLTEEAAKLAEEVSETQVPCDPRLLADDTSPEKLATLLRDQGGRMALMSPEGDIFDLMAGRYSSNNAPNFGVFLKAHAGDDLRVDRVGRPPEFVKAPALTIGLAVQPEVIRALTDNRGFRGRGLLGRFLYSMPKSLVGRRAINPPPIQEPIRETYCRGVLRLLKLPFAVDESGCDCPHELQLGAEARESLRKFAERMEPRLAAGSDLSWITDWAAKLVGAVARVAGLLHMAEHLEASAPWDRPVEASTMEKAILIGEYLIPHAKAAFAEMGADPTVEGARRVLAWLERSGLNTVTKREVYQGTKGRFRRVRELEPVLDLLSEHGFIRERPDPDRLGPGRPQSPTYDVHPWVRSHNSQNPHNSTFRPALGASRAGGHEEATPENRDPSGGVSGNLPLELDRPGLSGAPRSPKVPPEPADPDSEVV